MHLQPPFPLSLTPLRLILSRRLRYIAELDEQPEQALTSD